MPPPLKMTVPRRAITGTEEVIAPLTKSEPVPDDPKCPAPLTVGVAVMEMGPESTALIAVPVSIMPCPLRPVPPEMEMALL